MNTPNLVTAPLLVGQCLDDTHPERDGLYRVEYVNESGESVQCWAESLNGVRATHRDRVLLSQPANRPDPIILGVIGFGGADDPKKEDKPAFEVRENNVVVLNGNSPIQVVTHDGRKLVEIGKGGLGPTIRICQRDAAINLPGKLCISAGELQLRSHSGDVQIAADQEVVIQGDLIRLN